MSKYFVFVCLLASLSCAEDAVEYKFTITPVGATNRIDCGKDNDQNNPVSVTILESHYLNLIGKAKNMNIAFIHKCQRLNHKKPIVERNTENELKHTFDVKIDKDMGGIWNCSLLTDGAGIIEPIFYLDNTNYATAHCFLRLHVRRARTPQTVLVNNMILPTTQSWDKTTNYDHNAVYYYSEGDFVNVSCIINTTLSNKYLSFSYNYAERYYSKNRNDLPKSFMDKPNKRGYAFRTTLGAEHKNSVMSCISSDDDDYTTVNVKFVLKEYDETGYLAVNGHIARINEDDLKQNDIIPVNYMFFENEHINITCSTNLLPSICSDSNVDKCYKCDGNKYGFNNMRIDPDLYESKSLTINLPIENIALEMYDYKDENTEHFSWTYYRYDEGDKLSLIISKFSISPVEIDCKLNDTNYKADSSHSYVPLNRILTSDFDKLFLNCTLKDPGDGTIYKKSYVQFLKNEKTTTTSTTTVKNSIQYNETTTLIPETGSQEGWEIPVVAVLMIIVIIIVIMVIYRMRKQNQKRETDRNEILQSPSETSIPPYPPQWTATEEQNYHVPVDLRKDNNVYAVPINAKETPYAVPIPKSCRKGKGNNDLIYAELNIGPRAGNSKTNERTSSNNEPTYAALNVPIGKNSNYEEPAYAAVTDIYNNRKDQGNTELYSQVLPKGLRKNNKNEYDNVFPDSRYVNSSGAEYVEPTYIEAPRK